MIGEIEAIHEFHSSRRSDQVDSGHEPPRDFGGARFVGCLCFNRLQHRFAADRRVNSGPGWPPAASERFGDIPSLHVENATLLPGGTGVQFIAHIDTINPDTPLIGPPGHFTIDVVAGHVIQFLGGSLGCH